MAEVIKRRDISEEDVYKDVRESAEKTIKVTKELNAELIENARIIEKDVNKAVTSSAKGIRDFIKLTEQANKKKKEAIALDKQEADAIKQKNTAEIQLERIKQAKLKTEAQEIRNAALLQTQKEKQAKAQEKAARAAADESNAYKKLVTRTREQKNESKQLAAQMITLAESGKRNSAEYRKLAVQYRQVTAEAQNGDKALKKIDSTVGDNFRNVGNYSQALGGLKAGLLRLGGALGIFRALRGVGDIVANFDQAQGDLLAISGKTKEQLAGLTAQAKELGATTQFSATEITQMQIELAKLGFTTKQISQSTGAVANFAAATGAAIPEAAALAGSALRGFGLDASEMERVVSTLGVATTKSALDFEKLNTGLSTVAPVAAAFGFSIEDTTALLGGLANAGFDASSAATATRNILLNLADANGDLAKELGRPINGLDDLAAGLSELEARGIDLGTALELTDKRSVAAFQTFLNGTEELILLRDSITGANEALEEMARKRLDTISGQFTLLSSAWEGFILGVNEGSGAGETVKNLIGALAENLGTIMLVLGQLTKLFLLYKVRLIAMGVAQKLFNDGAGKMNFSVKTLGDNFKKSTAAGKGFGSALTGIGWAVAIGLAAELVTELWNIVSGANQAAEAAYRLDQQLRKSGDSASARSAIRQEELTLELADLQRLNDEALAAAKTDKERAKIQEDFLKKQEEAIAKTDAQIRQDLKLVNERKKATKDLLKSQDEQLKQMAKAQGIDLTNPEDLSALDMVTLGLMSVGDEYNNLLDSIDQSKANLAGQNERLRIYTEELQANGEALKNATSATKVHSKETEKGEKKEKARNTEFKNTIDLLKELNSETQRQIQLQQQLNEITSDREIKGVQEQIDAEIELQKVKAGETGGFDFSKVQQLTNDRLNLEISAIEQRREFEILAAKQANEQRFFYMRDELIKERDELLSQEKLTKDEKLKIEANYQTELDKIKTLEIDAAISLEDEIKVIKSQANEEILDLEKSTTDELIDLNKDLTDSAQQFADKRQEDNKKALDKTVEDEKAAADKRKQIAQILADYLIKKSDEKIAKIDEEIAAAEKQADFLRDLAAKGNIEAGQSLAENQRLIEEANKKKAAEERRKQRIQLANTAYQAYNSNVEAGSKTPLADTIRDISLLQAFINSLPAFESGTENTGANGKGLDGKGGFLSVLHPYERVMDAENNSKVPAGMSNAELAQIAHDYDTGKFMRKGEGAAQIGGAWQTSAIVERLNSVENAIKSQPNITIEIEKLSQFVSHLTTTRKSGNITVTNRNRIQN